MKGRGFFGLGMGAALGLMAMGACSSRQDPTASSAGDDRVTAGTWGGEHVHLAVSDTGGRAEFDCAHGSLDAPLEVDTEGRFGVPGNLVLEGGPERVGESRPGQSVRYVGRVQGGVMDLKVLSSTGEALGTFQLELGRPAQLLKCL